MDAVVYPDKDIQEITKAFLCVRIDVDREPELAKKYDVHALTDIRLLAPNGQEKTKLVGFTSAKKLAAQCRALLDDLAGRAPATSGPSGGAARKVAMTPANVDSAVKRGIDFLRRAWTPRTGASIPGFAPDDMVLFTWAACGVDAKDEMYGTLRDAVLAAPLAGTYQAAFRALALSTSDPTSHRKPLESCAEFLVRTQLENGQWTYGPGKVGEANMPRMGDNSNTAYALLGLAACRKAGVEVPPAVIEKADAWWRSAQRDDGGWGYRIDREQSSYASMTESGAGSLTLCARILGRKLDRDAALARALRWITQHYSVSENSLSAYQPGRLLYHLYALERLGSLSEADSIGGHAWYGEGAELILGTQRADGSWDDGADTPIPNTCFALLFLVKATKALAR